MKALKAALEELESAGPYADILQSVAELEELATYAENNDTTPSGVSMESLFQSFKEPNYLEFGHAKKASVAMEEMHASVWAAIGAIAVAIVIALKKFYDWAFGKSSSSSSSSDSSSGGHITAAVEKVEENTPVVKKQADLFKEAKELLQRDPVLFTAVLDDMLDLDVNRSKHIATEEMSSAMKSIVGNRKYIESMEDVLTLYIKDDADQNPAWQFLMVKHDGFSDDIMNNGPYSKMVGDVVNLVRAGQFSAQRTKQLHMELENLLKDADKNAAADFDEFNEKLGDYEKVNVSGMGSSHKTVEDLNRAAREEHSNLVNKFINGRLTFNDVTGKLSRQLDGSTARNIVQATDTVKKVITESEKSYENFRIEANVMTHHEATAKRHGNTHDAAKHRSIAASMRHMSKFSKNLCDLSRIMFVYAKGLIKIMEMVRNAGNLALRILIQSVLPRVKNEDSKERITKLGKDLKVVLAQYSF